MIHYHNFEQVSDEWFEFKKGKPSASNATPIGANGAGLVTYCMELAMQMCGIEKEFYTNKDIERGNEYEPLAATSYEFERGITLKHTGCITNDLYLNVLASPDGLVGKDGGIEIKAKNDTNHFALIQGDLKGVPKNQIQMTLLLSGRKWWDFVSFNPNFTKSLFIYRVFPDIEYFEKLKTGFIAANKMIIQNVNNYNDYKLN